MARDSLAVAMHEMEQESQQMSGKDASSVRLAQAQQTIASQMQALSVAQAGKASAEERAQAADAQVRALQAELAATKAAFSAANESIAAQGHSSEADSRQALAAAQIEIANLKAQLAAAASSGGATAAVTAERDALMREVLNLRSQLEHGISTVQQAHVAPDVAKAPIDAGLSEADKAELRKLAAIEGIAAVLSHAESAVKEGEELWIEKKKRQALKLYEDEANTIRDVLPPGLQLRDAVVIAIEEATVRVAEAQPAKAGALCLFTSHMYLNHSSSLV